jgi:hypothetical protein
MKFKKKSKLTISVTILLTLFVCMGATAVGAYVIPNSLQPDKMALEEYHGTGSIEMKTVRVNSEIYYLIDTEEQLRSIGKSKYTLQMNYMLNHDISLTSEWTAIGDFDHPFSGTFDGNGFEIINLKNTDPNAVFIGLFGYADGAKIHNVRLRNIDIGSAGGKGKHVGPIVAIALFPMASQGVAGLLTADAV